MTADVMTLPKFQAAQAPPSLRAPLRSFIEPFVEFAFGRLAASVTTAAIHAVDEQPESAAAQQQEQERETENMASVGALTASAEASLQRIARFREALNDALELSSEMVHDEEGDPVDSQTLQYAALSLSPLIAFLELPTPLILPLQNGGLGAEWHASGMNIELRFRKPYDVYAVLEDAWGVTSFRGRDPDLERTRIALGELGRRVLESTNPQVLADLNDEAS
jgi:hypothetical protein